MKQPSILSKADCHLDLVDSWFSMVHPQKMVLSAIALGGCGDATVPIGRFGKRKRWQPTVSEDRVGDLCDVMDGMAVGVKWTSTHFNHGLIHAIDDIDGWQERPVMIYRYS